MTQSTLSSAQKDSLRTAIANARDLNCMIAMTTRGMFTIALETDLGRDQFTGYSRILQTKVGRAYTDDQVFDLLCEQFAQSWSVNHP